MWFCARRQQYTREIDQGKLGIESADHVQVQISYSIRDYKTILNALKLERHHVIVPSRKSQHSFAIKKGRNSSGIEKGNKK